ncbi:MAG: hypothetical protein IPJ19_18280 [Planctomycetes bacterium]|nr:hypothetical protein [Planctomycetota bacterium]
MKQLLARLGLVLVASAVALCVSDWAAGRWLPLPAMVFRLDDELLYAPLENARRVQPLRPIRGSEWITMQLESHGFRGDELDAQKRDPRVLVLGDSLVMAQTTRLEDTYCAQLEVRLADELGRGVEVVNAGASGYGPDQECLRLEQLLGPLAPDLVLLVLCAHNDFGDLVRDKLFGLDNREELVRLQPRLDPGLVERFRSAANAVRKPALLLLLGRLGGGDRPALLESEDSPFLEWYLKGAREEYQEFQVQRDPTVRSLFQDYYDADVSLIPDAPSALFKQRLMERVLARVRDDCVAASVPLCVLVVPSSVDLCPDFRVHVDPSQYPHWTPTRMTDAYAAILRRIGVPFVDLAGDFAAAGPETLFLDRTEFHWNRAGAAIGVERTLALLREQALWPPQGAERR